MILFGSGVFFVFLSSFMGGIYDFIRVFFFLLGMMDLILLPIVVDGFVFDEGCVEKNGFVLVFSVLVVFSSLLGRWNRICGRGMCGRIFVFFSVVFVCVLISLSVSWKG